MLGRDRPVVVAVCGSPGAGKTTVASATARRLRVPHLHRDQFKNGLGLSSASVAEDGSVQFNQDFHISGGPFSLRAEDVMVDTARLLAVARGELRRGELGDVPQAAGCATRG
jgi:broad-specificity NMP kinase